MISLAREEKCTGVPGGAGGTWGGSGWGSACETGCHTFQGRDAVFQRVHLFLVALFPQILLWLAAPSDPAAAK